MTKTNKFFKGGTITAGESFRHFKFLMGSFGECHAPEHRERDKQLVTRNGDLWMTRNLLTFESTSNNSTSHSYAFVYWFGQRWKTGTSIYCFTNECYRFFSKILIEWILAKTNLSSTSCQAWLRNLCAILPALFIGIVHCSAFKIILCEDFQGSSACKAIKSIRNVVHLVTISVVMSVCRP